MTCGKFCVDTWENQHSAYAKTKTQISFAVTAKLISAFVFATQIVQFINFLNPKFPVSSILLCLNSLVCVGPVWKPHSWFSHEAALSSLATATLSFLSCRLHLGENLYEPLHEKTNFGFQRGLDSNGPVQYSHGSRLEARNFIFKKKRDFTYCKVITKTLISCAVTANLICIFVFPYAFSAHLSR